MDIVRHNKGVLIRMEGFKARIYIECPYCGKEHYWYYNFKSLHPGKTVHNCYEEDGGCGKDFVVDIELKTVVNTYRILEE